MAEVEDILTLEESISYVRTNMGTLYPIKPIKGKKSNKRFLSKYRGKTMGSIPDGLHKNIFDYAKKHKLTMGEVLAGLWDFYEQYEEIYADELKEQRKRNNRR